MRYAKLVAIGAFGTSLGIHGAGVSHFRTETHLAATSASAGLASIGNSFDDLVAGVTSPSSPTTQPSEPDDAETPTAPETLEAAESTDVIEAAEVRETPDAPPEEAEPAPAEAPPDTPPDKPVEPVEVTQPVAAEPETPTEEAAPAPTELAPVVPEAAAAPLAPSEAPPVLQTAEAAPLEATTPEIAEAAPLEVTSATVPEVAPVEVIETIAAVADGVTENAVPVSPRPPRRPPGPVANADMPPPSTASVANSATNALKGQTDGEEAGADAYGGAGREMTTSDVDEAVTAQYGNLLMERLSETERERVRISGEALISFKVSETGELETVTVARSSGSIELDEIALNHIRRAAPFPPPPVGARTTFTILFTGQ